MFFYIYKVGYGYILSRQFFFESIITHDPFFLNTLFILKL